MDGPMPFIEEARCLREIAKLCALVQATSPQRQELAANKDPTRHAGHPGPSDGGTPTDLSEFPEPSLPVIAIS